MTFTPVTKIFLVEILVDAMSYNSFMSIYTTIVIITRK